MRRVCPSLRRRAATSCDCSGSHTGSTVAPSATAAVSSSSEGSRPGGCSSWTNGGVSRTTPSSSRTTLKWPSGCPGGSSSGSGTWAETKRSAMLRSSGTSKKDRPEGPGSGSACAGGGAPRRSRAGRGSPGPPPTRSADTPWTSVGRRGQRPGQGRVSASGGPGPEPGQHRGEGRARGLGQTRDGASQRLRRLAHRRRLRAGVLVGEGDVEPDGGGLRGVRAGRRPRQSAHAATASARGAAPTARRPPPPPRRGAVRGRHGPRAGGPRRGPRARRGGEPPPWPGRCGRPPAVRPCPGGGAPCTRPRRAPPARSGDGSPTGGARAARTAKPTAGQGARGKRTALVGVGQIA